MYKERQVVVRLHGGLGNQLFQIVAARYLATKTNRFIKVYIGDLDKFSTKRFFEIQPLLKDEQISQKIDFWSGILFNYKISKLISTLGLHSISKVRHIPSWNGQFLNGYFQDIYNYTDFKLLDKIVANIDTDLKSTVANAVDDYADLTEGYGALHLRLKDFIISDKDYNFLLEFRLPYILKAVQWVNESAGIKKVIVFTDDVVVAKKLLKSKEFIFFKDIRKHEYSILQEFYLLSSFKYLITSNSTFSFWSSIFGKNKTIVFPSLWKEDDKNENSIFIKNIELHSKMFLRDNYIKVI